MEMEYPNSGINLPSLLTEEEKWLFDLNGYLIKKNAVDKERINDIVSLSLDWLENPKKVSKPDTAPPSDTAPVPVVVVVSLTLSLRTSAIFYPLRNSNNSITSISCWKLDYKVSVRCSLSATKI